MFIRTIHPGELGSELDFEIRLDDDFTLVQGRGEVAWVRQAGWAGQVRKLGERLKQWGAPVALAAFLIEPSAPKKVSTP